MPIYGGLGKKEGGDVFEGGGVIPQCTLCLRFKTFKKESNGNGTDGNGNGADDN